MQLFGQEVSKKTLLIGGGLMAAAVVLLVWLRSRAGSAQSTGHPMPDQPQDYSSGGMTVAAPTPAMADSYTQAMQNAELDATKIANDYQRNLMQQQEKQFDFQMGMQQQLLPEMMRLEKSRMGVEEHYNKAAAKAAVSCPGNASVRTDPATGELYCRGKTSGSWGPVPVGSIVRAAKGVIYGAEQAAPSIGYEVARDAAHYYTGKVFGPAATTKTQPKHTANVPKTKLGTGGYRAEYQDLP